VGKGRHVLKIESMTEAMFAQAVALAQNGKMKSTIHCGGNEVLIQNMDNTILIRFKSMQVFDTHFSFFANDYESSKIRLDGSQIVFVSHVGSLRRLKVCAAPKSTFDDIKKSWVNHVPDKKHFVIITKNMIDLLDENLSHVEVSKCEGESVNLIQRDIYSGARIEVGKTNTGKSLIDLDDPELHFDPVGIRTVDFQALFSVTESLNLYFQDGKNWLYFEDNSGRMGGIIATCIYDELGYIGREEE